MQTLKNFYRVLRIHFSSFIIFELIHKLLMTLVMLPLGLKIFNATLNLMDISYITNDTFKTFMSSPYLILLAILLILIYIFFSMFEVFGIVECFNIHNEMKLYKIFKNVLRDFRRLFYIKNIGYLLILIFYIPIVQLSFGALVYFLISAPRFLVQDLNYHILVYSLLILMVVNLILMLPFIYIIHYFVIDNVPFKEAIKRSMFKMKGKKIKTFFQIVSLEALITIIFITILLMIVLGSWVLVQFLDSYTQVLTYLLISIRGFIRIYMLIYISLQVPLLLSLISYQFYRGYYLELLKEIKIKKSRFARPLINILIMFLMTLAIAYTVENLINDLDQSFQKSNNIEVMAHRGSSNEAPENTKAAFELAIEQHSDYIELDIQQTKDGELVVMHDSNLKRVTGIDKFVYECTYEELLEYDIGSHFDPKFSDERVMRLEEVLRMTKGKIKLNIEIKPTGHEKDLERQLVDILKLYRMEESCVITSMNYKILQTIKSLNPDLKTGYVLTVALGEFYKMNDVDCFSIQMGYISENVVAKAHEYHKEIYVWTVNTQNDIVKMIDLGVDGIISDEPQLAHELIYSSNHFPTVISLINFLFR